MGGQVTEDVKQDILSSGVQVEWLNLIAAQTSGARYAWMPRSLGGSQQQLVCKSVDAREGV